MYYELEINGKVYRLKLTTRNIVQLEKKINCNPLFIFGTDGTRVPTIGEMVAILWASLQTYNHNITMDECYDIFDDYIAEHSITDFIMVIMEIFKTSGLISERGAKEKN